MSFRRHLPYLILLILCAPLLISGENKEALLSFIPDLFVIISN